MLNDSDLTPRAKAPASPMRVSYENLQHSTYPKTLIGKSLLRRACPRSPFVKKASRVVKKSSRAA